MSTRLIRVLVLSPIPEEGAGCRYRIAQFVPYLEANGFDVTLSSLYTTEFFRLVYKPGHMLQKAVGFGRLSLKRLGLLQNLSQYDVVFLYRELFPVGPALVERSALFGRTPVVFDFDDAIFLPSASGVSEANRMISALKFPGKMASIVRGSDHVIAGNEFLAAYARRFNPAVTMIPTSVDTTKFVPRADVKDPADRAAHKPVVGWIGSPTTAPYVRSLIGLLGKVSERHPFKFRLSGAGEAMDMPGVDVETPAWSLQSEVSLFNTCDIGVYPLPDDDWSRGKCGFKAIQFMSCGVPVVASAVGVNCDIIQDGVTGFLASTGQEWDEKLRRLLSDPDLRARMGHAARRSIEERYALRVHAPALAAVLRKSAGRAVEAKRRVG